MSYYGDTEYYDDDIPRAELESSGEVKMKQLIAGQWESDSGVSSYSVIGLGEDGCVYRYDVKRAGWIAWSMRSLQPVIRRNR